MAVKALSAYATVTVQAVTATTVNTTGAIAQTVAGNSILTVASTVAGATAEVIVSGKTSGGAPTAVYTGLNRFFDNTWSLSDGATPRIHVSMSTGQVTITNGLTVSANGITVVAGTSAFQAVTATGLTVSGTTSYTAGGVTSYIGQVATPGQIINGSQAGDLLIRAGSKRIVFSPDDGATSALVIAANSTITTSSAVTIGGALQLGNAYVAGAPSATGYVTLKDNTGTTYKVLVST